MSRFLVLLAIVAGIGVALYGFAPDALAQEHNRMSFVFYLCWLALMGGAVMVMFRDGWRESARNAAVWILIALALVAGYSVRHDVERFAKGTLASLLPGVVVTGADGTASLRRSNDGHFYLRAEADGVVVRFMVDTGATMVALTESDAERMGITVASLSYNVPVRTANGITMAAATRIHEMRAGDITMRDVEAAVMPDASLGASLLGMSFLGRLDAFSFEGDTLILRP